VKEWGKEPVGRKGSIFWVLQKKTWESRFYTKNQLNFILFYHLPQGKPGYTRYDNRQVHWCRPPPPLYKLCIMCSMYTCLQLSTLSCSIFCS
jgi:hypothetical protein